jgi:hypothetical protein
MNAQDCSEQKEQGKDAVRIGSIQEDERGGSRTNSKPCCKNCEHKETA